LTNAEARDALFQKTQRLVNELIKLETRFVAQQTPQIIPDAINTSFSAEAAELNPNMDNMGLETDAEVQEAISPLIATLDTDTRQKIIKIYADGTVGQIFEDTREEVPGTRYRPR